MRVLDRYIARQFLINAILLFVILMAIIVVADFAMQFDEYSRIAGRLEKDPGVIRKAVLSVGLVLDLWWPRLFHLYNYLLGIVLVGAMGFTLSQMVRHRELVAVLAGGVSLQRLAIPIVIVTLGLTLVQAVNREFIVPRIAHLLTRDKWDAGSRTFAKSKQGVRLPLTVDASGRLWYAREFNPIDRESHQASTPARPELVDLTVWERNADGLPLRRITARSASWSNGAWRLEGGQAETYDVQDTPPAPGQARTQPRPLPAIETDLDPTTLTLKRYEGYGQNVSTAKLGELIASYRAKGAPPERIDALNRIRFGRISIMGANVLALLVCMPFFLQRSPANMLRQSVYCAPVAIVAVMGSTLGASAAIPGLPPALGAMIPVMVLLPLAVAAMSSVRT